MGRAGSPLSSNVPAGTSAIFSTETVHAPPTTRHPCVPAGTWNSVPERSGATNNSPGTLRFEAPLHWAEKRLCQRYVVRGRVRCRPESEPMRFAATGRGFRDIAGSFPKPVASTTKASAIAKRSCGNNLTVGHAIPTTSLALESTFLQEKLHRSDVAGGLAELPRLF
jgi:hypothetical protein